MTIREELQQKIDAGEVHRHHSALSRGYLRQDCMFAEHYSGRFGEGYILHHPNRGENGVKCANHYHIITYYTK